MPALVEQTLAEQLNITSHEIEYRKHVFDFTEEDVERLASCRALMEDGVEDIVRDFYVHQVSNSEIAEVIGDADSLRRLHGTMRQYLLELCGGEYDLDYVNRRLHIGKVHRRMGVSPKLYMGSMRFLQTLIEEAVAGWCGSKRYAGDARALKSSFQKILLFDAQLVFDAYIDSFVMDVDKVKMEIEAYANTLELTALPRTRQLHEISTRDKLTNLYNHRAFYDFFERELAISERHHLPMCLVYFDLNGLKKINDSKGHEAGNEILARVGAAILQSIRKIDIPCRYGGDEFCLILPRTKVEAAKIVCERLIDTFRRAADGEASFSIGVTQVGPRNFVDMNELLRMTDELMYEAKKASRVSPGFHIRSRSLAVEDPERLRPSRFGEGLHHRWRAWKSSLTLSSAARG